MYRDKKNDVFNIFKKRKFWFYIVLIASLILLLYLGLKVYVNESIVLEDFIFFFSLIFAELVVTVIYCSVVDQIKDFFQSSIIGKISIISSFLLLVTIVVLEIIKLKKVLKSGLLLFDCIM
ncbi:hypothetical protein IMX26_09000 [Clostridium sp. 'deep sea']|uniref:hypothetical protein n=1 Tax=Clostridium sp. 'deep sea' TaxID=2779445 RepID=UPI001896980E|nr:hypothetical protein [Clostridium sp. 'deep sea']QOR33645.1 hypothetical protein IMX26_09000 [Clostridium sp. 'deep sea']